ncbi:hypothetical protein Aduo_005306 [Ancylostoma duodenale]
MRFCDGIRKRSGCIHEPTATCMVVHDDAIESTENDRPSHLTQSVIPPARFYLDYPIRPTPQNNTTHHPVHRDACERLLPLNPPPSRTSVSKVPEPAE